MIAIKPRTLLAAAWIVAYGALAGSPAHNSRPCPIPALEMLPDNPPPAVPSPAERAAQEANWHSNAVARAEERAAVRELAIMLAAKSGLATNDLDADTTDATATRAAILRAAAGRSRTTDPWPEYGTNAAGFAAEVKRNRK
jgi:hypothetical protein